MSCYKSILIGIYPALLHYHRRGRGVNRQVEQYCVIDAKISPSKSLGLRSQQLSMRKTPAVIFKLACAGIQSHKGVSQKFTNLQKTNAILKRGQGATPVSNRIMHFTLLWSHKTFARYQCFFTPRHVETDNLDALDKVSCKGEGLLLEQKTCLTIF